MARVYKLYDRTKIPRNKYGTINNYNSIGGTSFYSSDSISQVGAEMPNLNDFLGATSTEDGVRGLVPAPEAGQNNWYYLRGNGSWDYIPAAKWLHEWPTDEGLDKRGLGIDGDFHVSNTLSTMDLNVEGRANFWELVIDKARANGGEILISPSLFQIDFVGDTIAYSTSSSEIFDIIKSDRPDIWKWITQYHFTNCRARRLWMKNNDGRDHTFNEVSLGDMMRCRTFNLDGHATGEVMHDVANTDYWTFVCGIGKGTFIKETEEGETEFEGFYMDLAFALTGTDANYDYVPINTLFGEEGVEVPENWVKPDIYNELKQWTFNVLCGSTQVEEEFIESETEENKIIEYDFAIRGVSYILSEILGTNYNDDSLNTLYSIYQASNIAGYILFGSDDDNIEEAIRKILGVDVGPYAPIAGFEMNYGSDLGEEVVNGNTGFNPNSDGMTDPSFEYHLEELEARTYWRFGYGVFEPREGQQLACLGNLYDFDRQNAIIISSVNPIDPELVAPSIAQYNGIDIFGESISQFRLNCIARNGSVFTGSFMVKDEEDGSYFSVNDQIEMYIRDIYTGLEVVGIHLDGQNSTITMRGSVELHQHSDKDDDTLSVWDYNNFKKVEIKPTEIPYKSEIVQTTSTRFYSQNNTFSTTVPSSYIEEKDGWRTVVSGTIVNGWSLGRTHEWAYKIGHDDNDPKFYGVIFDNSFDIGSYSQGDKLDIKDIQITINLGTTTIGNSVSRPVLTYSTNNTLAYVRLTLMRGTNNVTEKEQWINYGDGLNVFNLNVATFLDDYEISTTGEYRLKYYCEFCIKTLINNDNLYSPTQYSNPTARINISHNANALTTSVSPTNSFMTIGTNGMVYSVGNGDYFYAGEQGFEFKLGESKVALDSYYGLEILKEPQFIDSNHMETNRIYSEIVICQRGGYSEIFMPLEVGNGKRITIFGYNGLRINSNPDHRFKIYSSAVGNYTGFNWIEFSNTTNDSAGTSDAPGCRINTGYKVELVTASDGTYVISQIL